MATEEWEISTNANGTGMYFDIVRAAYEKDGYKLELLIVPCIRKKRVKNDEAGLVLGLFENEESGSNIS